MPHDKLGEEVAAAVVLKEGKTVTERELRDFAEKHLVRLQGPAARSSSSTELPQGRRPASCSASGWRRSSGSGDEGLRLRRRRDRRLRGRQALHRGSGSRAVVARGPHLAAMKANGLILKSGGETRSRTRAAPTTRASWDLRITW